MSLLIVQTRLETEDEVLDLAEDLYKFMEENSEDDKNSKTDTEWRW